MVQAIMLLMVLLANSAGQSSLIYYLTVLTVLMQSTETSGYPDIMFASHSEGNYYHIYVYSSTPYPLLSPSDSLLIGQTEGVDKKKKDGNN
jgi:hypothetical protein